MTSATYSAFLIYSDFPHAFMERRAGFRNASRSCRTAQGAKHLPLCAAAIRRRLYYVL